MYLVHAFLTIGAVFHIMTSLFQALFQDQSIDVVVLSQSNERRLLLALKNAYLDYKDPELGTVLNNSSAGPARGGRSGYG